MKQILLIIISFSLLARSVCATDKISALIDKGAVGETVHLPEGTFDLAVAVKPKSGMKIIGAGSDKTIIRCVGSNAHAMISIDGQSDIELAGFVLDGNNNVSASQGIEARDCHGLNIHDIRVRDLASSNAFGPHGVYFSKEVTDSIIADCKFTNIGKGAAWGGGIRVAHGSNHNRILRNSIATTGRGGILGANSTDLVILDNTVTGSGGEGLGIEIQGCARSLVEDNRIDHWLSVDNSSGSAIRRNIVRDQSGTIKFTGIELVASHDVLYTDNTVDGGAIIGISVSNNPIKERALFARNIVRGATTWSIQIQGDAKGAHRLYFYGNTFADTHVKPGPQAFGLGPQGHGVRFNGNATNIVFDSNTISGNDGMGIVFIGEIDRVSFINNTITKNGGATVTNDEIANLEWANNTVAANGTNTQRSSRGFADAPPAAEIAAPADVRVGESARFSLKPRDNDEALADALWDFDDGLPGTGFDASHVYTTPGNYEVCVIAWNKSGRALRRAIWVRVIP